MGWTGSNLDFLFIFIFIIYYLFLLFIYFFGGMGGKEGSSSSYLGLPLGVYSLEKAVRDLMEESRDKKLTGWKHLCLSRGKRLTLLKGTSENLPAYYLFVFASLNWR